MGKKILFVATVVKTHILEFHVPYLKMMQELGWETSVAGKNDFEPGEPPYIPYCDHYVPVDFGRSPLAKSNLDAYRKLKKLIDENHYDIIHCHTPVAAFFTRLAARHARKEGTKVIYTAHGYHFFKGAPLKNWLLYFPAEWITSFYTDLLININREDYAFSQKHIHAKRLEYVKGVGVPLERFRDCTTYRASVRESLGLQEDDFVLLSVAELTKNKNHAMMLRAMKLLDNPKIHLVCAGRGQEMENCLALQKELGLEDRVHFLGYRNDVPMLYGAADAFLFVSFREGLSLSLMEAMSSGLCAIVSPIRGNVDLIDDGVNGLYTALTPEAIAEAVTRAFDNPDLRARLGAAAKEKVQQFSLETISQQMKRLYLSM